MHTFPNLFLIA